MRPKRVEPAPQRNIYSKHNAKVRRNHTVICARLLDIVSRRSRAHLARDACEDLQRVQSSVVVGQARHYSRRLFACLFFCELRKQSAQGPQALAQALLLFRRRCSPVLTGLCKSR